jgi:DNA gyrase subunit A
MTMRRLPGEELIGAVTPDHQQLLLVSSGGGLVRIDTSELRYSQRGDLGTMAVNMKTKTDRLVGLSAWNDINGIVTSKGRHGRLDPNSLDMVEPGANFSDQLSLQKDETVVELISTIQS